MGQKLYSKTQDGGIKFTSRRKGEVRIPNYVYDLWFPLLGATAIGVYSMYCRLEREDVVKAMTLKRIAKMCRIGTEKLEKINAMLERCGFIKITKPTGHKRLMHWTTEIEVFDPSEEVDNLLVVAYQAPSGYECMSPWLVEDPNRVSDEPKQGVEEDLVGVSKVVSLGLNPLNVESCAEPNGSLSGELKPSSHPVDIHIVDSEYLEETCPHCQGTIILRNLKKSAAICQHCKSGLRVFDGDGIMVFKPPQSMRAHRKTRVLGDVLPECPIALQDVMYYARDEKNLNLWTADKGRYGALLESLMWAVGKYANGQMKENEIVKNALTAVGKRQAKTEQLEPSNLDRIRTDLRKQGYSDSDIETIIQRMKNA